MTGFALLILLTLGMVALRLVVLALVVLFMKSPAQDAPQGDRPAPRGFDRTDSRYWKLGGFYMNPHDPNLFVAKRNPALGVTINLGHPQGRIVAAGLLLGVALLILLTATLPILMRR